MSEENIKKMGQMLRNGAKMLDQYCPKCENILFQLKDHTIFCTNCNTVIKLEKDSEKQIKTFLESQSSISFPEMHNIFSTLFTKYTQEIKNTTDIILIEKYLEISEKILNIIEKLRTIEHGLR